MDNVFPCLILYHKQYVQDQPYTEEIQIPRVQVHTHTLKTVNSVYLPTLNSHSHFVSGKVLVFFSFHFLKMQKAFTNGSRSQLMQAARALNGYKTNGSLHFLVSIFKCFTEVALSAHFSPYPMLLFFCLIINFWLCISNFSEYNMSHLTIWMQYLRNLESSVYLKA